MSHRIDRKLIDGILDGEDASDVVSGIDRYIAPRDCERPDFGLTRPEFNLRLFCIYTGEVGNGGHTQFFLNPSGGLAARTLTALEEMGLPDLREILLEACSAFGGSVPLNPLDREACIDALPDEVLDAWARLDRRLYDRDVAAHVPVVAYLRRHRSEILAPETA